MYCSIHPVLEEDRQAGSPYNCSYTKNELGNGEASSRQHVTMNGENAASKIGNGEEYSDREECSKRNREWRMRTGNI